MSLNIKIENFEGPFDLLLHLIKKNEMDIYDIKIYEITSQYLEYIDTMKEMDLEVTSEFIVIAATLLEIKSKILLPKSKDSENDDNLDPRKELVDKLLEYKRYKLAAELLKEKEIDAGVIFTKKPEIIDDYLSEEIDNSSLLKGISILDLYNIYEKLITRFNSKINTSNVISREIPVDSYKIEDKMDFLRSEILKNNHMRFSELIFSCANKIELVVTFLALLELIKLRQISVTQEDNFNEIYIEGVNVDEEN
ncbi:MAG: segregation/condensation protein A [Bacillota bacterium]|nr:segregation/condensation protein A [Bacillota bacterium]